MKGSGSQSFRDAMRLVASLLELALVLVALWASAAAQSWSALAVALCSVTAFSLSGLISLFGRSGARPGVDCAAKGLWTAALAGSVLGVPLSIAGFAMLAYSQDFLLAIIVLSVLLVAAMLIRAMYETEDLFLRMRFEAMYGDRILSDQVTDYITPMLHRIDGKW